MMGWLSGWSKRVKITVDSGDVDSDLSWFPILIYLSASSGINGKDVTAVFDEVGSNRKKIAVTKDDGTTQLYVEVEKWDLANEKAWLWISRDGWIIDNAVDTDFYLYFDNTQPDNTTYVGDPNSTPAENVWETSAKLVTHMRDDPDTSHIRDSTNNNNDGTKKAANEPIVTTSGKIDDAQDFDGTDDYVQIANSSSLNITSSTITLNACVKLSKINAVQVILHKGTWTTEGYYLLVNSDNTVLMVLICDSGTVAISSTQTLTIDTWYHIVGTYNGTTAAIYVNGIKKSTSAAYGNIKSSTVDLYLARRADYAGFYLQGLIDEDGIYNEAKSDADAWVKASYETQRDHILTYGSEELGVGDSRHYYYDKKKKDKEAELFMMVKELLEAFV